MNAQNNSFNNNSLNNVTVNLTVNSSLSEMLENLGNLTKKDKFKEIRRCYNLRKMADRLAAEQGAKASAEASDGESDAEDDYTEDSEFLIKEEHMNTYKDISDEELDRITDTQGSDREHWPTPTIKTIRENVNLLIETEDKSMQVYKNGFAVYTNLVGKKSVVWVPDCVDFTARYVERDLYYRERETDEDFALSMPWTAAVLLLGDIKCEKNRSNTKGDRGKSEYDDNGCVTGKERSEDDEKVSKEETISCGASCFDSPERALEKKETLKGYMRRLTPGQQDVVFGYYVFGFNYEEMGRCLGITKDSVKDRMKLANIKLGDAGIKFLENASHIEDYYHMYMDDTFYNNLMSLADARREEDKKRVSYRVVGRKSKN